MITTLSNNKGIYFSQYAVNPNYDVWDFNGKEQEATISYDFFLSIIRYVLIYHGAQEWETVRSVFISNKKTIFPGSTLTQSVEFTKLRSKNGPNRGEAKEGLANVLIYCMSS